MKILYGRSALAMSREGGVPSPRYMSEEPGGPGWLSPRKDSGEDGLSESLPCQSSSSGSSARSVMGTSAECRGTPESAELVELAGTTPLATRRGLMAARSELWSLEMSFEI